MSGESYFHPYALTGTFDLFTTGKLPQKVGGHLDIVYKTIEAYRMTSRELGICVGYNANKISLTDPELRLDLIEISLPKDIRNLIALEVASAAVLTPEQRVKILVRGVRSYEDIELERTAFMSKVYDAAKKKEVAPPDIHIITGSDFGRPDAISSTGVRDILASASPSLKEMKKYVHPTVAKLLIDSRNAALENTGMPVFDYKKEPAVRLEFNAELAEAVGPVLKRQRKDSRRVLRVG